jgi:hypothetical protein
MIKKQNAVRHKTNIKQNKAAVRCDPLTITLLMSPAVIPYRSKLASERTNAYLHVYIHVYTHVYTQRIRLNVPIQVTKMIKISPQSLHQVLLSSKLTFGISLPDCHPHYHYHYQCQLSEFAQLVQLPQGYYPQTCKTECGQSSLA